MCDDPAFTGRAALDRPLKGAPSVSRSAAAAFLLVEENAIIAADLAQSILECAEGAAALNLRDRSALEAELARPEPRTAVFLPA